MSLKHAQTGSEDPHRRQRKCCPSTQAPKNENVICRSAYICKIYVSIGDILLLECKTQKQMKIKNSHIYKKCKTKYGSQYKSHSISLTFSIHALLQTHAHFPLMYTHTLMDIAMFMAKVNKYVMMYNCTIQLEASICTYQLYAD